MTTDVYPEDLDTTSVGWSADKDADIQDIGIVMDEMLKHQDMGGIIQVCSYIIAEATP